MVARANSITPVVAVGKATAGPANHRRSQLFQAIDKFFADAIVVRHLGVFSHPDAVINAAAQMLGEMAVDIRRDDSDGLIRKNIDAALGGKRRSRGQHGQAGEKKIAPLHG